MRTLFALALLVMMGGCDWKIAERTYVEPAGDWKWRCCTTEYTLFGTFTGCSSPITYDQAMWWKEKGGSPPSSGPEK